jgi:hypothetical protein
VSVSASPSLSYPRPRLRPRPAADDESRAALRGRGGRQQQQQGRERDDDAEDEDEDEDEDDGDDAGRPPKQRKLLPGGVPARPALGGWRSVRLAVLSGVPGLAACPEAEGCVRPEAEAEAEVDVSDDSGDDDHDDTSSASVQHARRLIRQAFRRPGPSPRLHSYTDAPALAPAPP